MQNKLHLLMIFSLTLVSCQGPILRQPSSEAENKKWNELRILQQKKFELQAASVNFEKKKRTDDLERTKKEIAEINIQISTIENQLEPLDSGWNAFYHSKDNSRIEEESIDLNDIKLYALDKKVKRSFSTYETKSTTINLQHTFFTAANYTHFDNDREKPYMTFTMKCDGPFAVKYGLMKKNVNAGQAYSFRLKDKKQENDSTQLIMNQEVKNCDVKFVNSLDDQAYGFALQNEEKQFKAIDSLVSTTEKCSLLKNSEHFIDTNYFPNMTCPQKFDSLEPLSEPEDSLHARVVALLGQDLPKDFVKNANPLAQLDFSKAPKFDTILVSYLVFRADFYGTLIGRLLAYHADQGALVRVMVSDVIALKKDEAMFEKLMAEHPNLKFTRYRFDTSYGGGAKFSELHRTNHVKLFIAYSKDEPKNSFVIVGGRNIHDGFVFRAPIDVSAHPTVVNYTNNADDSWAFWRDFEMVIKGQDYTESVVRHFMNFYHINKENFVMKVPSVAVANENVATSENGTLRHMISIPFKDDPNLNHFYAKMIDSAKKKVLISSPYFRPVKEISEALDRAIERGVDITIITRLDLEGDTADFILGAVNKDGVNKFLSKVKVYEYIEPKVILHSKLLMVDDEVSFVSSVNLNKRSFYHDLENGTVINDRDFTVKMGNLYKEYLKLCRPLTEKQKIVFWKKWLIGILDKVF